METLQGKINPHIQISNPKWNNSISKKVPSPNPKQGIKLSSSKAAKVFPMIDMACS